jgi:hypothetical protein
MAGKAKLPGTVHGELYYRIPESGHEELGQIRDELGMLAGLTFRYCCNKEEVLHLSSDALAQCFARLSLEITEIMEKCLSPSDCDSSPNRSMH